MTARSGFFKPFSALVLAPALLTAMLSIAREPGIVTASSTSTEPSGCWVTCRPGSWGGLVAHPAKHPQTRAANALKFAVGVISPAGQGVSAAYRIGGQQMFFPEAPP